MAKRERTPIDEELREAHEALVSIFQDFGVSLDYSLESLKWIEDYLEQNYPYQEGAHNPFPAVRVGVKLYFLGAYAGETLIRKVGGSWSYNEKDPLGQIRAEVRLDNGKSVRPIEEVMTQIEEGRKLDLQFFLQFQN